MADSADLSTDRITLVGHDAAARPTTDSCACGVPRRHHQRATIGGRLPSSVSAVHPLRRLLPRADIAIALATCGQVTESPTYGVTRNPWDLARTSGGTSGGTAVAIAAGLAPVGLGADGAGSIRVPAAFCGLFALAPSRGRISTLPDPEPWYGLTVFGGVGAQRARRGIIR
ncbi:MAG: hypothetical protein JO304_18050 [Solirubrobacterales bacterium]|nr:hypothetical protein [Solirubrobacterales bacterium]